MKKSRIHRIKWKLTRKIKITINLQYLKVKKIIIMISLKKNQKQRQYKMRRMMRIYSEITVKREN
jgi:hypothetical protein